MSASTDEKETEEVNPLEAVAMVVEHTVKKALKASTSLTKDDVKTAIIEATHDHRVRTAMREATESKRIFADIEGVTSSMTPFRVTSEADLDELFVELKNGLKGGNHIAMAICLIEPEKHKPLRLRFIHRRFTW